MSEPERLEWERQQGFKSFGTICDEFYETIDPERFKSIQEVQGYVAQHNDKIELYTSSNGEIYCVTRDFNNTKRYLMNGNREYVIGSVIVKDEESTQSEKAFISSNNLGQQKASAEFVQSDEIIAQSKIGSDNYRMHIWIDTYNSFDGNWTYVLKELKLSNFARWLAIWWERTYSTEYRITLKTTDVAYGLRVDGNGSDTIIEGIKSKYIIGYPLLVVAGPGNSSPQLVYYSIYAKNEKGCLINRSKTY
ncbi:MAG: hypothetical protein VB102_03995 [Paludibacter sp.]|nr:hypothetical protein [Paludibacter sp.]